MIVDLIDDGDYLTLIDCGDNTLVVVSFSVTLIDGYLFIGCLD